MNQETINVNDKVICRNPKTGQTLTTGAKLFHSLYRDKGFELVTRDNMEPDGRAEPAKPTQVRGGEPRSVTGSAAAVAKALGVVEGDADPATSKTAVGSQPEGTGKNEVQTNANQSDTIDDERTPNKRDRGRSS
jgi:hypothetical protein